MKPKPYKKTGGITAAKRATTIDPSAATTVNKKSGGYPWFDENAHNDNYDINPESTTRCRNWEDLARRKSYEFDTHADGEANPEIEKFDFGPLDELRCVRIGDQAWCAISDACRITGAALDELTGYMPDMWGPHVRCEPNFLKPDGIRSLYPQGILDLGIQLEAFASRLNPDRCGGKLMEHLVNRVFPAMYPTEGNFCDRDFSRNWPYAENQPDTGAKIHQHRYHNNSIGELRAVAIGTRALINVADLSRCSGIEERVISQMAGSSRTAKIANLEIRDADEPGGVASFVTSDAACAFLNALERGYFQAEHLKNWVSTALMTPQAQLESGRWVSASSMHGMLENAIEFTAWVADIRRDHPTLLGHLNTLTNLEAGDDFEIPLTEAFAIAKGKREYPGNLCLTLIRDGGFFHHGPLTEPMDATFERLKGLVPDHSGLVSARAVHAFLGESCSFVDWMHRLEPCCIPSEFITMIDEGMMTTQLAYQAGLDRILL